MAKRVRQVAEPQNQRSASARGLAAGLATLLTLLFAVPTAFATGSCLLTGAFCAYSLIGPDEQSVLQRNARTLRQTILRSEAVVLSFERRGGLLQGNRVDVVAQSADQALVVDSRRAGSGRNVETWESADGQRILLTYVTDPGLFSSEAVAHLVLYELNSGVVEREHLISCPYSYSGQAISIRNPTWRENVVLLDVESSCSTLSVNRSRDVSILPLFERQQGIQGDTLKITLDDDLRPISLEAIRTDERDDQEAQYSAARADAQVACAEDAAQSAGRVRHARFVAVCTNERYTGDRFSYSNEFIKVNANSPVERFRTSCYGHDSNARFYESYGTQTCHTVERQYFSTIQNANLHQVEITLVRLDGTTVAFALQCTCRSLAAEGITYDESTRTVAFDLRANSNTVRVDGRDFDLGSERTFAQDVLPGYSHGRFQVNLSMEDTVASFARVSRRREPTQ